MDLSAHVLLTTSRITLREVDKYILCRRSGRPGQGKTDRQAHVVGITAGAVGLHVGRPTHMRAWLVGVGKSRQEMCHSHASGRGMPLDTINAENLS